MGRSKRAEVNRKDISNQYWLSKNRRKELKYFCLQYNDWVLIKRQIETESDGRYLVRTGPKDFDDVTAKRAAYLADISTAMELVERCAKDAGKEWSYYIFVAVTQGLSWNEEVCKYGIKMEKDIFNIMIDKFYWLLSIRRGI